MASPFSYKIRRGFSYIEVLLAFGLLVILFATAIPATHHATRNMHEAITHYQGHLLSQGMVLSVQHALRTNQNPQAAASHFALANDIIYYGVWIVGAMPQQFGTATGVVVEIPVNTMPGTQIITVITDEVGNITGRAVGVAS